MFQEKYTGFIEKAAPDAVLVNKMIVAGNEHEKKAIPYLKPIKRTAIAAIALLALVFGGIPALAANVPLVYDLMYLVSPATAQFFMPVQKASEDNGIRMEVVATCIHEDTAEVFVTMQDLTGDRVDATTDLFDSYSINRPFDSSGHCERVGYDEGTRTATFLIRITEWGGRDISGDKITFTVRGFLSDKSSQKDMLIDLDLDSVGEAASARRVTGFSGGGNPEVFEKDSAAVLGSANVSIVPVEEFEIVAAGFIGDQLHVQVAVEGVLERDNHTWLHLENRSGAVLEPDYNVSFIDYRDSSGYDSRVDYYNFVFDVPPEEISGWDLYGSFYTSGSYTQGDWRVTFALENALAEQGETR